MVGNDRLAQVSNRNEAQPGYETETPRQSEAEVTRGCRLRIWHGLLRLLRRQVESFFNRARGWLLSLGRCRGHGSFRARGASMRVARRRIDVSDRVIAPTFSAISAARVPGRDNVVAQRLMPTPTGNPPGVTRDGAAAPRACGRAPHVPSSSRSARRACGPRCAARKVAAGG
jgi:hypothetical protein